MTLELNTLGDPETRDAWRGALVEYFQAHRAELSRRQRRAARAQSAAHPRQQGRRATAPICDGAPAVDEYLTGEAADFFAAVTAGSTPRACRGRATPRLVRGLDYYRHTAFEFVTDRLGAQGTVIAGGRYDGLIEALGGPHTPAVGWAAGIERLAMMIDAPARADPMWSSCRSAIAPRSRRSRIVAACAVEGICERTWLVAANIEEADQPGQALRSGADAMR